MEPLANITEYACDDEGEEWPSINCVMKRLYSDFIVTEIPADGQVLKPKQAEKPKIESKVPDDIADDDHVVEVPSEFEARSDEMRRLKKVAAGEIDLCTFDLKEFPKDVRKKLYKFIEANYGEALFTSCEDGMLKVRRSNGTTDESRKRSHWSEDRGNFLHFTLAKVNWDTQSALAMMAKKLRLRPSLFSISGTKDRRAITVQRVCAFRVEKYKLAGLRCKDIWLSDFSYSNIKLQLGDACGNRFSIILRDIDPRFGAEKLKKRLERWQCCGFLNYFGSQRFGTCGVNTAQIGRLILAAKWEEAIRALLSPRTETTDSINECLKCFAETSDASKALRLLRFHDNSANIERTLLTFLAKNPTSYKAAILGLPRDVRTMYIHAYQSAVFNRIISKRKQAFGLRVLPGDLDKNGDVIDVGQDAEPVGIEQICLPLPCMEPKMPDNEVAKWYAEIAAEDELEADSYEKLERQFSLGSVYRPFVVRPANVSWELLKYSQLNEELQQCEFVPKNNSKKKAEERPKYDGKEAEEVGSKDGKAKEEQPQPFLALRVQFDLPPGTYATIALRELMRVDFSKQSQKAMEAEILAARQPKTNVEEATEDDGKCVE